MELPVKNVTGQNSGNQGYTDIGKNVTFMSRGYEYYLLFLKLNYLLIGIVLP